MEYILLSFAVVVTITHLGFWYAFRQRRNDFADVLWGLYFLVACSVVLLIRAGQSDLPTDSRSWIAFGLVAVWSLRLSSHIFRRFRSHVKEDQRYANWRKEWGSGWALRTYLQVFLLQSVMAFLIVSPVLLILMSPAKSADLSLGLGVLVWLLGFLFESIADEQLRRFKARKESKGKLMTEGLWSWSRHPNYFGEVVQWWGLFVMALPLEGSLWTIVSPVLITFFILKVSGVPMLEDLMKDRPGFQNYRKTTSAFWPRPPRRSAQSKQV